MLEDIEMTKLSGCKNPQAVTILLRGSSQHLVDELERAIEDATRVVQDVVEDGANSPCVSVSTQQPRAAVYSLQSRDTQRHLRSSPRHLQKTQVLIQLTRSLISARHTQPARSMQV